MLFRSPKVAAPVYDHADPSKWEGGAWHNTYYYKNGSILDNKVSSDAINYKGLIIFTRQNSTGWGAGWNSSGKEDTATQKNIWEEQYLLDRERWDPSKTDESKGDFPGTNLKWVYRDDIGELEFIGEGEVPDYNDENKNLFTWVDENAAEWLDKLEEPRDYMPDVKSVITGGATRIGKNTFKGAVQLYQIGRAHV